ncbi:MAG TPA: NAD(P)-dependent oxidoreductase [Methylomirabilota bacterium]|jgi:precorrin-2 dehydrogenase/sirohydrochlorin ferrochelatase|nr:NAD(P)-dependent oxidoreductase [Methylomirabilota bacterium]
MAGFFPMFLRLAGRVVVVVGGGEMAVRTVEALLRCDAEVRVISPALSSAFARFRGMPNLMLMRRRLQSGDLEDALLALAVDDDPAVNLDVARQGLEWNVLVSVADELALSDFVVPSFVHRGGLTLALHAGMLNASLASRVGEDLERSLGPEYGDFMAALQRAWERLAAEIPDGDVRQTLFARLVHSDLLEVVRAGGATAADLKVEALLAGSAVARGRGETSADGTRRR